MGVAIILEKPPGEKPITLKQWLAIVEADPDLRVSTESCSMVHPITGVRVDVPAVEGSSEFLVGDEWLPFLQFARKRLTMRYSPDMEEADNPQRQKIAAIARQLKVPIHTDAGDEPLAW